MCIIMGRWCKGGMYFNTMHTNTYIWRFGWIMFIDDVKTVLKQYHDRIGALEDEKYDMEYIVKRKDAEVVLSLAKKKQKKKKTKNNNLHKHFPHISQPC